MVDFDGTCVTHDFPEVGKSIGAERVLRKLVDQGHELTFFTMRCDSISRVGKEYKTFLTDAVNWFKENANIRRFIGCKLLTN